MKKIGARWTKNWKSEGNVGMRATRRRSAKPIPKARIYIPVGLRPYFQEYNPRALQKSRDANLIIERTLEFGTWRDVQWLFKTYGARRIRDFLYERGERSLSRVAFNYWRKLLGVTAWQSLPYPTKRGELWQS
jgi:hypothetical protein